MNKIGGQLENWLSNLIEGLTFLIAGLILTSFNFLNVEPIISFYNGSQISAQLNPTFAVLVIIGFFLVGAGTSQSSVTITIYKLNKKYLEMKSCLQNAQTSQ